MIPVLYPIDETSYTSEGLGRLADATECRVSWRKNDAYTLTLKLPTSSGMTGKLANGCQILAKPFYGSRPQPFEVSRISDPINGQVTVSANHISYRLMGRILQPCSASDSAAAMAAIQSNNDSDFTFTATGSAVSGDWSNVAPCPVRSALGGAQASILSVYGGVIWYDRDTVTWSASRSVDHSRSIRYGANMIDLTRDADATDVFTRLLGYYAKQDSTILSSSIVLDQTVPERLHRTYTTDLTGTIRDAGYTDDTVTAAIVQTAAQDYVTLHGDDLARPTMSYRVSAVDDDIEPLELVTILHPRMGSTTLQVVATEYDVLRERYTSIDVGDVPGTLGGALALMAAAAGVPSNMTQSGRYDYGSGASGHSLQPSSGGGSGGSTVSVTPITTGKQLAKITVDGDDAYIRAADNYTHVLISRTAYEALTSYDTNTIYLIYN
ncbi:MAG: phage tail protein [Oscillospiraceae bacterium]|nr:phage tail protein [Oscillospiraceae bacterium]